MIRRLMFAVALTAAAGAHAGPCSAPASAAAVKRGLLARYPASHVDGVRSSGLAGIYEVTLGRRVAYTDASGRYFLFGHLFDLAADRDLTAERLQDLDRVNVDLIRPDQSFADHPGTGKAFYVFSDPGCVHCRQLEPVLAVLRGFEVRIVMLPYQPGSMATAEAIWCAPDRSAAWRAWMLDGRPAKPASASCRARADAILDRNLRLAGKFGILGTPGLVAPDGRTAIGAMDAAGLKAWLSRAGAKPGGAATRVVSQVSKVNRK